MYIWLFETKDKKKTDDPRASEPPPQAGNQPAAEPIVVGFGSGFVIQQGFIVTNNHVAGDADGLASSPGETRPSRTQLKLLPSRRLRTWHYWSAKSSKRHRSPFASTHPNWPATSWFSGIPGPMSSARNSRRRRGLFRACLIRTSTIIWCTMPRPIPATAVGRLVTSMGARRRAQYRLRPGGQACRWRPRGGGPAVRETGYPELCTAAILAKAARLVRRR